MKYKCPHCQKQEIKLFQKIFASKAYPATCSNCHNFSYLESGWIGFILGILTFPVAVLSLYVGMKYGLLLFPLIFLAFIGIHFIIESNMSLKPISEEKVKKSKLIFNVFTGIVAALIAYWIIFF